jgi:hypothetical protein
MELTRMTTMTVAHVLPLAAASERVVEYLYMGLAARFSHYENLSRLWRKYGREEADHAQWLEGFRGRLSTQILDQVIDPKLVQTLEQVAAFPVEKAIQNVADLSEAIALIEQVDSPDTHGFYSYLILAFDPSHPSQ